ncbi:MAG: hypothetical protein ACK4YP_12110 [Myxococcota bacterium]
MFHLACVVALLLVSAGCRAPWDASRAVGITPCPGADPGPVPGYEAYAMSQAEDALGRRWALNRAWADDREVAVDVDLASFAATDIDPDALLASIERALAFWNAAEADVRLTLGDTDATCCATSDEDDCRACVPEDATVHVYLAPAADPSGRPAHTEHTLGDDPDTDVREPGCLVGSDVVFFPEGLSANGARAVSYTWVSVDDEVSDLDDTDGTVDKPFHNTLVHELGHVLGLGDQHDATVACSVMAHCADLTCGCDWDRVGPVDATAVGHVYGP